MAKAIGSVFFILLAGTEAFTLDITGTVTDSATKNAIEGATVSVKGTDNTTTTDQDGKYTISETTSILLGEGRGLSYTSVPANTCAAVCLLHGRTLYKNVAAGNFVRVLSNCTDGIYLIRFKTGACAKAIVAGRTMPVSAVAGKGGIRGGLAKQRGASVTLVFSKSGYFTREVAAQFGQTVDVELVADPQAGIKPGAHNTGYSGTLSAYSGPGTITTAGAKYENFSHTGTVNIDADNVVLRNFKIDGGHYCINIKSNRKGIVIEDGELYNMASCGILGMGFTARRLHIHDSDGDGVKAQGTGGPVLVEYCFIEKLGKGADAHADGNQTRGGSNITFRYNNIFMPNPGTPSYPGEPYKSNATFMLQLAISNFVIENNWLTGGNYCIYSPGGVSVRNNKFGRHNGGWPDKVELRIKNGTFDEWTGNTWEDTGSPCPN
jgi:hypothetical protein